MHSVMYRPKASLDYAAWDQYVVTRTRLGARLRMLGLRIYLGPHFVYYDVRIK